MNNNPFSNVLPIFLAAAMLENKYHAPYLFNDGSPQVYTYGSDKYNFYSSGEWKLMKHDKIGRNDPCTCGSGKKFKRCCGAKEPTPAGLVQIDNETCDENGKSDDTFLSIDGKVIGKVKGPLQRIVHVDN